MESSGRREGRPLDSILVHHSEPEECALAIARRRQVLGFLSSVGVENDRRRRHGR
jgi:hypothetical protein